MNIFEERRFGNFSFDAEWKIRLDEEKCILCGKCVDSCPHRALSLPL